jgi:hypothetical protein
METRRELKDIPVMFTRYNKDSFINTTQVRAGNANWKYQNPDGEISIAVLENLSHPMDNINLLSRIKVPYNLNSISFDFSVTPSSFTVKYWPDQYAGIHEAYDIMYENLKVNGNFVNLPHGEAGYIFQVHAMWPQGYADYEFYMVPSIRFSQALK